jgi:serine/threonine protein phosphatase 1
MSTYAVGDVHGCLKELKALVTQVLRDDPDARFVFLGDYVDRGPDSKGVLDYVMAMESETQAVCLKGNHEDMLLHGDFRYAFETFESFGYEQEKANLQEVMDSMQPYLRWMEKLPVVHETENALFVHGGLSPRKTIDENRQSGDIVMWYRHVDGEDHDFGKHTYHGHTPQKGLPLQLKHRTNVDCACVYGGHLVAARVGHDGKPSLFYVVQGTNSEVAKQFPGLYEVSPADVRTVFPSS